MIKRKVIGRWLTWFLVRVQTFIIGYRASGCLRLIFDTSVRLGRCIGQILGVPLVLCLISAISVASPTFKNTEKATTEVYALEHVADGFQIPWGLTFIRQDLLLVSERQGGLYLLDLKSKGVKTLSHPLSLYVKTQGGLLDVSADPSSEWIYTTYAKALPGKEAATALSRFKISADDTVSWQEILVTESRFRSGHHFGSRIAFDEQGHVFFTIGDRGERPTAQDLRTHAGKILRLKLNGDVPSDNPFYGRKNALPEIWSYGHRNPQGIFFDKARQSLWSIEHGPRGGDEINLIEKGGNYGWPVVSHGKEYSSPFRVGEALSKPGMIDPIKVYVPSIAPSSLIVYDGGAFKQWRGDLFAGALKLKHINRVRIDTKNQFLSETRLFEDLNERIRAITQSPEGWVYFSTDNGNIYRIKPIYK